MFKFKLNTGNKDYRIGLIFWWLKNNIFVENAIAKADCSEVLKNLCNSFFIHATFPAS